MVSLRSQIDELQRQISKEQAQIRSGHTNSLLADYRAAVSAENALKVRVAQLKGDVLDLRGRSIQYTILQRDVDTNRALYDALLQRYKQIGVAGGLGAAPVSIVDRADVPRLPFKPNLFLNLLMGLGLGLAAGVGGAIGLDPSVVEMIAARARPRKVSREPQGLDAVDATQSAKVLSCRNTAVLADEVSASSTAAMPIATMASATSTSIRVNPLTALARPT